jgi:hypothetical protein
MFSHESLLLFRCQLHHAVLVVGVKRREDPAVGAKVGMAHVGRFDRALQPERNFSKRACGHAHLEDYSTRSMEQRQRREPRKTRPFPPVHPHHLDATLRHPRELRG